MSHGDLLDIFRAKERRRRELAALPFAEKIRQIEALHAVGMELRKLRPSDECERARLGCIRLTRGDGAEERAISEGAT
jgi:hypothetical protein